VETTEICNKIKHSIGSVENYLEKFKRVAFLRMKNFTDEEIALTIGISINATKTFIESYCYSEYQESILIQCSRESKT
jgi:DNA-binding CsgD family transcriptional regulator